MGTNVFYYKDLFGCLTSHSLPPATNQLLKKPTTGANATTKAAHHSKLLASLQSARVDTRWKNHPLPLPSRIGWQKYENLSQCFLYPSMDCPCSLHSQVKFGSCVACSPFCFLICRSLRRRTDHTHLVASSPQDQGPGRHGLVAHVSFQTILAGVARGYPARECEWCATNTTSPPKKLPAQHLNWNPRLSKVSRSCMYLGRGGWMHGSTFERRHCPQRYSVLYVTCDLPPLILTTIYFASCRLNPLLASSSSYQPHDHVQPLSELTSGFPARNLSDTGIACLRVTVLRTPYAPRHMEQCASNSP
jgi:hypothetical protein